MPKTQEKDNLFQQMDTLNRTERWTVGKGMLMESSQGRQLFQARRPDYNEWEILDITNIIENYPIYNLNPNLNN